MSRFLSAALCALFVCSVGSAEASAADKAVKGKASADAVKGKAIYDANCTTCHTAAIGGAPKLGDKVAWAPRIKQGEAVLVKHAIEGYQTPGSKGMKMMAKAGKPALSDGDVANAVAFMVKSSK